MVTVDRSGRSTRSLSSTFMNPAMELPSKQTPSSSALGRSACQHGDVFLGAEDVAEREADEFNVVVLHKIEDVLLGRIAHKDPLSRKTPKGLPSEKSRSLGWCKK